MEELEKSIDDDFGMFLDKVKQNLDYDDKLIKKAYFFARKCHLGQKRYGGIPYISHPLEVAKIVFDYGLDTSSIVAALLHDVVEDTDTTLDDIKKEFSYEVELLVDGLTKISSFIENREDKNIEAIRKVLLASAKDIRVLIIKLCDRLHNMRTLEQLELHKKERIARNTMLIYAPIAQKIGIYSLKWELEDLAFKYKNPEMFQLIRQKIGLKRREREDIVGKAVQELRGILAANGVHKNLILIGRPKNFYSIYKKIKDKAKSFDEVYDLYAVRIIVKDIPTCYMILGILHDKCHTFPDRLKDYIANPKANGYQSIHTNLFSNVINGPVEIQIRTEDMHKLAEYGVAAHWKYKNLKEDKMFEKKISWLREVMQWEKENKDNIEFLNLLKYDFFQNEIYVFTPKNDVIFLPEGASVLDFAYAVHTEIGDSAYKGKVNGILTNIDKVLKNGDIVEIIKNKTVKPSEKWLKCVKTSKAKLKIRDNIKLKYTPSFTPTKFIDRLSFENLKSQLTRVEEFKKVRKAGCCNLKYGDQVVGVVTKEGELAVHNASCDNAKFTVNKKIPINWIENINKEVEFNLVLKDRFGIMVDILNIFSKYNVNLSKLNTKIFKNGDVKMNLKMLDGPYINNLISEIKKLDSIVSIEILRGLLYD